ncbi:helix-turn-helix transcriptional regulator [Legionella drozanskii]|uniref:Response regulator containing a CheY-like receiver domain and an HTH DNA-binding domain protein n=1 Tax=Legionella drozanskii LLAP-1 TaxID=1212489 RepID=A0A0W0SMM3_9GAMM|nr:helix-turn-helix transcriptional regulator [Legionella drozanskii]KTC84663.1 Response regulator containing a CheY-like receiver domain and an HTH DNA-binding domain protein [Legionella drozanskii LLAP-1]
MIEQFQNHPSILHTTEINLLCEPLNLLDITRFSHLRVFKNNQLTVQCNQPQFLQNYLDKKYYAADPCVNINPESTDLGEYLIWDAVDCSGKTAEMLADSAAFDFKHVFTIIKKQANYTDFYHFGTHLSNPAIHQIYINNLEILDRFIRLFNSKIKQSKTLARAYDIVLNTDHIPSQVELNLLLNNHVKRDLLLEILMSSEEQFLTANEIKCAELILEGKTAKEIAKILELSHRTIEDRIYALKLKLNAKNKADLIVKLIRKGNSQFKN